MPIVFLHSTSEVIFGSSTSKKQTNTQYCYLISKLFSFLRWNLSILIFCFLVNLQRISLCLCSYQSVIIIIYLLRKFRHQIMYLMPFPIYSDATSLTVFFCSEQNSKWIHWLWNVGSLSPWWLDFWIILVIKQLNAQKSCFIINLLWNKILCIKLVNY